MLSKCMGASRVMYNMRTTRPDWLEAALFHSDWGLRGAFQSCTGLAVSDAQWAQAALPLSKGGLGFRSAATHAPAAYLASRLATRRLCREVDAAFVWEESLPGSGINAARCAYNTVVAGAEALPPEALTADQTPLPQKFLSAKLDAAVATRLLSISCPIDKARLRAVSAPHASAWLNALPSPSLHQRMSHAEFVASLQLWLGMSPMSHDTWCPKCDQSLDKRGLHALSCMAGGDAILCHNALRDHVYLTAKAAGLCPEREEAGLLKDDPRRRPGDLFFAVWPDGEPVAMDFAVTSPVQQRRVAEAAGRTLAAAEAYEEQKLADRSTGDRCRHFGLRLVPMIAESYGGWGLTAQKAFKVIARAGAARNGKTVSDMTSQLYSGLSIKLMRANARSLLARVSSEVDSGRPEGRARTMLEATS